MRAKLLGVGLALAAACSSRPKVGADRKHDGGPSVVVVERQRPKAAEAGPALGSVPVVEEQEPNDTVERAQPFEFPKGAQGHMGPPQPGKRGPVGDADVYQWLVAGEGRQAARVVLTPVAGIKLGLEVLDGDGARVASGGEGEGGIVIVPNLAVEAGRTYYLRVAERGKPAGAAQPYRLVATTAALAEGEELEPNGDAAHATPLGGSEATGFYGAPRDEDWLRVAPQAPPEGATLRVDLEGVDGVTPALRVVDAAGATLVDAKGARSQPLTLRNAPLRPDGVFVVVRAEAGSSAELRWLVRVQVEPPVPLAETEPNDTPDKATVVTLGGAGVGENAATVVRGFLWPGDADCWRGKVAGSGELRVEVAPPEGAKVDLKLEVLGIAGKPRLVVDDAGAGQPEILPTWYPGSEVMVRVSARAKESLVEAPYQLSWQIAPPGAASEREPDNDAASATLVTAGAPVRGYLAPRGDEDWYAVTAPETGGRLRAALDRAPPGTSPIVRILDGRRAELASARGTSATAVVPAGPCFVVVRDAAKGTSPREPYQLTVSFE